MVCLNRLSRAPLGSTLSVLGLVGVLSSISACGKDPEAGDTSADSFNPETTDGDDTQSSSSTDETASTSDDPTTDTTDKETTSSDSTTDSSTSGTGTDSTDESECEVGLLKCGLTCIDPLTDRDYCGAQLDCLGSNAGTPCSGIEECENAECVCPDSWVRCDGACINPLEDAAFCGATADCAGVNKGTQCGANEVCDAGVCVSGCNTGEVLCDGSCINPNNDFNYCGAKNDCTGADKGIKCAPGQVCTDGACEANCKAGQLLCDNRCIDPSSDNQYCGASMDCAGANEGSVCTAPQVCVDGSCALNCNPWQIKCEGQCINPLTDPDFCGASAECSAGNKGVKCGAEEICSNGSCTEAGCGEANFDVALPPSDVMLVVDKSGSMSSEKIEGEYRWPTLHDVVSELVADYGDNVRFGLKLFPKATAPVDSCDVAPGVELAISDTSSGQLLSKLPARSVTVYGETPTASGMVYAVEHMSGIKNKHPKAILLIADGGITASDGPVGDRCPNEEVSDLLAAANYARSLDIPVYSIGILVDEMDSDLLKSVVAAHDYPDRYVDAANKASLQEAMESILAKISSCVIPLDPAPQFPDLMEVKTSGGNAPWLFDYAGCEEAIAAGKSRGFVYTKRSGPYDEIELCATSCDEFKDSTTVEIQQNCPPPP